jgi:hypothetical protein
MKADILTFENILRITKILIDEGNNKQQYNVVDFSTTENDNGVTDKIENTHTNILYSNILVQAARVGLRNRHHGANYIVVTQNLLYDIKQHENFEAFTNTQEIHEGVYKEGQLAGRFNVYSIKYPMDFCIMGFDQAKDYPTTITDTSSLNNTYHEDFGYIINYFTIIPKNYF